MISIPPVEPPPFKQRAAPYPVIRPPIIASNNLVPGCIFALNAFSSATVVGLWRILKSPLKASIRPPPTFPPSLNK